MPTEQLSDKTAIVLEATNNTSQLINSELMLIDIEAPLAPISDWTVWGEWALWGLLLLIALGLFAKFSYRLYRPAYLRWQLLKLMPKNPQDETISFKQAWLLYGWCLQLKSNVSKYQTPAEMQNNPALIELNNLIQQVEQLSFSKQSVSRETYLNLLAQAKQVLQLNCGLKPLTSRFKAAIKAKFRGAR